MSDPQTAAIWGWRGATRKVNQRLKHILGSGERSDIQFVVGEQYGEEQFFRAHKYIIPDLIPSRFVLSLGSDVFDTMFYGEVPETSETIIRLPTFSQKPLLYLYTDVVEDLSLENVLPTLYCAKKYGIPELVNMCAEYAIKNVDKSTCLTMLEAAKVIDAENVVKKCLDIVDTCCSELLHSQEFPELKKETLRLIFSRDTLVAKEDEVYKAAERWASNACRTNRLAPTSVNYRRILGEVLFLVRFPLIDDRQLVDGPGATGLLLDEELLKIYRFKNATRTPDIPVSGIPRTSNIVFCDRQWTVLGKPDTGFGMLTPSNTIVDQQGHLHLRCSVQNGVWKGAGIQSVDALGFGRYELHIDGLSGLGPNVGFALYSQAEDEPGAGISFSWSGQSHINKITFSIRRPNSLAPFAAALDQSDGFAVMDTRTTHFYHRKADSIAFSSCSGQQHNNTRQELCRWSYNSRPSIPQNPLPVFICLLKHPDAPSDSKDVEVIVRSFRFYPDG